MSGFEGDRRAVTALARENPRSLYDARYRAGYERDLVASGYDACVLAAFRWALDRRVSSGAVRRVLDYGCGRGRYLEELRRRFPTASLAGTEISPVALKLAAARFADVDLVLVEDERVPLGDGSFDVVVCLEVVEHVADAARAVAEIARVVRPGGHVVVSAPCANPLSAGWTFNLLTGGFERTTDGFGRFRTDDPAHLRRLRGRELRALLLGAGLAPRDVRYWGHLAAPLADSVPGPRSASLRTRCRLALLDWRVARRLPNGGGMIAVAQRMGSPE